MTPVPINTRICRLEVNVPGHVVQAIGLGRALAV